MSGRRSTCRPGKHQDCCARDDILAPDDYQADVRRQVTPRGAQRRRRPCRGQPTLPSRSNCAPSQQAVPGRARARPGRLRAARRRSPRPVRRERRRQVDADLRCSPAWSARARGASCSAASRSRSTPSATRATARHQRGVPGILAGTDADRRGEPVPRRRAAGARLPRSPRRSQPRRSRCWSDIGFHLDPDRRVGDLGAARAADGRDRQSVARRPVRILILDEPTASLTERETERLFALIEQAEAQGRGDHLHHPPHGRVPAHCRPRHGAARRAPDRHRLGARDLGRATGRNDDRASGERGLPSDSITTRRGGARAAGHQQRRRRARRLVPCPRR